MCFFYNYDKVYTLNLYLVVDLSSEIININITHSSKNKNFTILIVEATYAE